MYVPYITAYWKRYNIQHVHICLLQEWRNILDNNLFVGAVLVDLSSTFDCMPCDLAEMTAYESLIKKESISPLFSYLTNWKQCVMINNIYCSFWDTFLAIPQGSILGPLFSNLTSNNTFFFIEAALILNFTDNNTLYALAQSVPDLSF